MLKITMIIISLMFIRCGSNEDHPSTIKPTNITSKKTNEFVTKANIQTNQHQPTASINPNGFIVLPLELALLNPTVKNGQYSPNVDGHAKCFMESPVIRSPNQKYQMKIVLDAEINTQYAVGATESTDQKILDIRFKYTDKNQNKSDNCKFSTNKLASKWLCTGINEMQIFDASYNYQNEWTWEDVESRELYVSGPTLEANTEFTISLCNLRKSTLFNLRKIYLIAVIDE